MITDYLEISKMSKNPWLPNSWFPYQTLKDLYEYNINWIVENFINVVDGGDKEAIKTIIKLHILIASKVTEFNSYIDWLDWFIKTPKAITRLEDESEKYLTFYNVMLFDISNKKVDIYNLNESIQKTCLSIYKAWVKLSNSKYTKFANLDSILFVGV